MGKKLAEKNVLKTNYDTQVIILNIYIHRTEHRYIEMPWMEVSFKFEVNQKKCFIIGMFVGLSNVRRANQR